MVRERLFAKPGEILDGWNAKHTAADSADRTAFEDYPAYLHLSGIASGIASKNGFLSVIKSPRWKIKNIVRDLRQPVELEPFDQYV